MMNKKMFTAVIALVLVAVLCCACQAVPAVENGSVAADYAALALSHSTLELPLDGARGKVFPLCADDHLQLQWCTADSSVAEVSGGLITPVAPGCTVITCTDGVNTASCTVIVNADMDMDYELRQSEKTMTLGIGATGEVEYTYTGPGTIAVFSSNPQVLQVENGRYKAVSTGEAVITCSDGIRFAQCLVVVTE